MHKGRLLINTLHKARACPRPLKIFGGIMGRFEVQGIVSMKTGQPLVQMRQVDDNGVEESRFQVSPIEAREIAQNILEATFNSVYDAALIAWAKEAFPEDEMMGAAMVDLIRKYRADKWGLPDRPEDWR
jgi:hypothetical protein